MSDYNPKHPWGKPGPNSTIVGISEDNILHATMARDARRRIAVRQGSAEDRLFVAEREAMIKRAVEDREGAGE